MLLGIQVLSCVSSRILQVYHKLRLKYVYLYLHDGLCWPIAFLFWMNLQVTQSQTISQNGRVQMILQNNHKNYHFCHLLWRDFSYQDRFVVDIDGKTSVELMRRVNNAKTIIYFENKINRWLRNMVGAVLFTYYNNKYSRQSWW